MNMRFLLWGAILGGIALFLWGAITHTLLPQPLHRFKDEPAMLRALHADGNGIYLSTVGVFAVVAFRPDFRDKTHEISSNVAIQLGTDMLAALFLCILLGGIRVDSLLGGAAWLAVAGMAAFALKELPYWNWYGFPVSFVAMEAFDLTSKLFVGGLVVGTLRKWMVPSFSNE